MAVAELAPFAEALRRNGMDAVCVNGAREVKAQLHAWLQPGETVAVGGSRTLEETGVLALLREGPYRFLDRYAAGLGPEQLREVFLQSLAADVYLCSANAVTARGEIYCVDGNGNRLAALCYGPRSVILIVGSNKLVPDLTAARRRVKTIAAPCNAERLRCATPCATSGVCCAVDGAFCTDGCGSKQRICCSYLTLGPQRVPGRIRVILTAEPFGF